MLPNVHLNPNNTSSSAVDKAFIHVTLEISVSEQRHKRHLDTSSSFSNELHANPKVIVRLFRFGMAN